MSFDFVRKKACFTLNYQTWWAFIMLAVGCGWEPTGTGPPRGVPARHLADTLEKVIAAPSFSSLHLDGSRISRWLHSRAGQQDLRVYQSFEKVVCLLYASGSGKKKRYASNRSHPWFLGNDAKSCLRDFVKFCRGGSFRIY